MLKKHKRLYLRDLKDQANNNKYELTDYLFKLNSIRRTIEKYAYELGRKTIPITEVNDLRYISEGLSYSADKLMRDANGLHDEAQFFLKTLVKRKVKSKRRPSNTLPHIQKLRKINI